MSFRRIAVLLLLSTSALVHADVITLTQTGTVGFPVSGVDTTDTFGYFGSPGASLAGDAFSITASYDSQYFTQVSCGVGCTGYIANSPNASALTLTINGVSQTPSANAGTNLAFETYSSGSTPFFEQVVGSVGIGFLASEDPAYWLPLTGLTSLDFANLGFGTLQSETIALTVVTSMSTSAPSPSAVPESGTLPLALTGLVGVFAAGIIKRSVSG